MNGKSSGNRYKNSRSSKSQSVNLEYPGQPYYDENGILHIPEAQNRQASLDPYEEEYRRQLEQYSAISRVDSDSDVDLQFHSLDEIYGTAKGSSGNRSAPAGRAASSKKRKSSEPSRSKKYTKDNLQFGSHTKRKSESSSKRKKENGKKVQNKKKSHPVRTFFKVLILLILVVFILANLLLLRYINMVNIKEQGVRTVTDASLNDSAVKNILIIGSDTRDEDEYGRTDSMILLSINSRTKEITMTSFMRDMYVNIVGKRLNGESIDKWDKLNAAYVYGGAPLLMDTIEYNFDIAVDDYVYIDFYAFVDIVDAIGGIEIEVSDEEAQGMKDPMGEQNKILGNEQGTDYLDGGGSILMNGNQALAYARLRYVGNADFERTERQREVILKIIEKVKSSDPATIDSFLKSACSNLTTNMSKTDMLLMSYKAIFSLGYTINSLRLPTDDCYSYGTHDGQSTLDVDFDRCISILKEEIYG